LALAVSLGAVLPLPAGAQAAKGVPAAAPAPVVTIDQPDAQRTHEELARLLERYPPSLRRVLALDSSLLGNQAYLAPYPALVAFMNAHPEVARNPSFYFGQGGGQLYPQDRAARAVELWRDVMGGLAALTGFGIFAGMIVWLIRTLIDYRRWSRLSKVQTDVHTKILDRFSSNEDMLAYIQSPAGSRFLQSSPITLDAGPRSVGAPLSRILWSVQGGLVLLAGGIGFLIVSARVAGEDSQPLQAVGVLAIALGVGFVASAIISFVISRRLGLIEAPARPETQG
jgi:hypothetical protein